MRVVHPGLTFIIPAYNEEKSIIATAEKIKTALASLDIPSEVIVVNDGSRDATLERASTVHGIRVISHPTNTGYGSAIKSGILCANYEWIGIIDADGTYDCDLIPTLVEKMKAGFDMVVAARQNVLQLDRPVKRAFRRVLLAGLHLLIAKRIEDPNSGLRLFRRDLAIAFFPFLCNTFSFTTSITIFALGEGCFVTYVPMTYSERHGESKVRHFRDSLRMAQLILQGITFFNPVKLALILACLLLLFGFVPAGLLAALGFGSLAGYYFAAVAVSELLFMLGIIADMVRLTATSRVHKPDVVVRKEDTLLEVSCPPRTLIP